MKVLGGLLCLGALTTSVWCAAAGPAAKPYQLKGQWIEGCACSIPCGCVMTGKITHGCEGVVVMSVASGHYGKVDLAGARLAVPHQPGGWAILYFDPATTPAQREAMQAILAPEVKAFGLKVESVKTAPISVAGADGRYTIAIPHVLSLQTEPVLGLDKHKPIGYTNIPERFLRNSYQGRTVVGSFKDGGHEFTLTGTNSFWANFNQKG